MATGNLKTAANRVKVAKDVLAQINSKILRPEHQTYVELNKTIEVTDDNKMGDKQLCNVLDGMKCSVCARGAIFVAAVKRFNDYKIDDLNFSVYREELSTVDSGDISDYEEQFFEDHQIALIEGVFEGEQVGKAQDFYGTVSALIGKDEYQYAIFKAILEESDWDHNELLSITHSYLGKSAKSRMIAIMKNIIANKGDFVIPLEVFQKMLKGTNEASMAPYMYEQFKKLFSSN